ncbi:MAG: hypothetical protein A3J52_02700 [Omnitrophica bacterium RIFCSPHIGHO2_02_FULL_49_9]|nr:MAG: hypothetical protein A3J52_02700 [Omnitrophica bacterium RIFCSPHIGHO2_02_FULL_49_9]OGW89895.1 MAG: hypothetical protein A3A73_01330 [Omnitrophica bacterium RIFCSPLOWO2_01_FULL_50_24]
MKQVLVFRHVPHEGLGTMESFLTHAGVDIRYCDLFSGQVPPKDVGGIDFVISMGGPMNVYETERYPFLDSECSFLSRAVQSQKPVLGVCLGAQMIARALGVRVWTPGVKEIGWYPIHLSGDGKEDRIFKTIGEPSPVVFQWHGDTFDLPKGAAPLASSARFQHQAFRYGTHVYAFQFHIEVTRDIILRWLNENTGGFDPLGGQAYSRSVLKDTERYERPLLKLAESVYPKLFSPLLKGEGAVVS